MLTVHLGAHAGTLAVFCKVPSFTMTTLGLLETDTLYDDLLADYGSYGQMFARFFNDLGGELEYRYYQVQQGQLPLATDECDAYLITGSKAGVYDSLPWIPPLQTWIADFHQQGARLIGVCFGHQIIAHSLGGHAGRSDKGWGVGVHSTTVFTTHLSSATTDNAMTSRPSQVSLLYSHQDQVETLPHGAQLLASSDFCQNAAFKIDNRVLSVQGHPEFTPLYLQRLLKRRRAVIGEARYAAATASLDQATDEQRVGRCLIDFIRNG